MKNTASSTSGTTTSVGGAKIIYLLSLMKEAIGIPDRRSRVASPYDVSMVVPKDSDARVSGFELRMPVELRRRPAINDET